MEGPVQQRRITRNFSQGSDGAREKYSNKLELMLSLVGYAVGFGNIWRFPNLTYSNGGGAFLVPYFLALFVLGLPLFVLELGLGQMFRQGTLSVWEKLGLPRLRGVGAAATLCCFYVCLYYNVILSWAIYYLGRTLVAMFTMQPLPWADMGEQEGKPCPDSVLFVRREAMGQPYLIDRATGLFNRSHAAAFWCPATGIPHANSEVPNGYISMLARPLHCPAESAVHFWHKEALQQSSGMDDLGGFQEGMLLAFTVAWVLIYFCVFKGIRSSGKVVYVTATLPYVALVAFFFRAITLPNALEGVRFFVRPDFRHLLNGQVWMRAVTQIFYSLGVGFGSLIAFASYGDKGSDFAMDAMKVSFINCGTSIFAGFVVFPILGYLAHELSGINPCINSGDLNDLASIGLSGTGLAFIAFPIAISRMPGGFFWALLFFIMLLCLGIDSQFAMVESVITVLRDAGIGARLPRPAFVAVICAVSYGLGLIFVTRGGIYWFNMFDTYSSVVALFFVTGTECFGLMWYRRTTWPSFVARTQEWTGRELGFVLQVSWKFICPLLLVLITVLSLNSWDLMKARTSVRYPEGTGYLPAWSVWLGWAMAISPIVLCMVFAFASKGGTGKPDDAHDAETNMPTLPAEEQPQTAPTANVVGCRGEV